MKRKLILLLALLMIPTAFAAIEYLGKCNEIGFEQNQTHCFLPDGSTCTLDEFNEGTCGEEYQKDFCVERGQGVWPYLGFECCGDLEPYFPSERGVGPEYCEDPSVITRENKKWEDEQKRFQEMTDEKEELKTEVSLEALLITVGIPLIIIGFIIWLIIRWIRKK